MNKMSLKFFTPIFLLLFSNAIAKTPTLLWEAEGFKTPESVLFDKRRNVIYVSNIDGKPMDKDGKGTIALLSVDGKTIDQEWVAGLNAPKGLALVDDILYVSDIDRLVAIDVLTKKVVQSYSGKNAKFLNDVVADKDGIIYVSDFIGNAIYRLKDGNFERWLSDKKLETPNGLLIENNKLLVASWGVMTDGFSTKVAGHVKSIDIKNKIISSMTSSKPIGNLDGIESDGKGGYYATDWMAGSIIHIMKTGEFKTILNTEMGSADLGIMSNILLVPMMKNNVVRAYEIID